MILQPERSQRFKTQFDDMISREANPDSRLAALQRLLDYEEREFQRHFFDFMGRYSSPGEDEYFKNRIRAAIENNEAALLARAAREVEVRDALREMWSARENISALARLGDPASFERVLGVARDGLAIEVDEGDANEAFQALVEFAEAAGAAGHESDVRAKVAEFFRAGFEDMVATASDEDDLINHTNFQKMAFCYARLNPPDAAAVLARQFDVAADEDQHYELNLVAGDIAILLSAYPETDPEPLREFIENFEQYAGDAFLLKTQYALWYLEDDRDGPLAYLRDPENRKSLEFAAAALADLHLPEGLPLLEELLMPPPEDAVVAASRAVRNPVVREALNEARTRLTNENGKPAEADRMIHLFGRVTATERALGAESDNIFLIRAESRGDRRYDRVLEVDDAEANADEVPDTGSLSAPDLPTLVHATPEALREIDEQYEEILHLALSPDQQPGVREGALKIIFELRPDTAATDIAPILTSGPIEILLYLSREILGERKNNTMRVSSAFAVDWLAHRLNETDSEYEAIVHLRHFDDERIPGLLMRSLDSGKNEAREALLSLGVHRVASAVPRIVEFLRSQRGQHVAAAAKSLALIDDDAARAALADPDHFAHLRSLMKTGERRWVARAVGYYRAPDVPEYLQRLLKHSDFDVREGAEQSLAWLSERAD